MDKRVELRERFGYSRRGNIQEIYEYYNILEEEVLKLESQLHLLEELEKISIEDFHHFYEMTSELGKNTSVANVIKAYLESLNLESKGK
jgi:hypothetical protein